MILIIKREFILKMDLMPKVDKKKFINLNETAYARLCQKEGLMTLASKQGADTYLHSSA